MNTFSKYGNELLNKMGMKTNSSGSSDSIYLPLKKAKFVKRFDMKVTTLQSYGVIRRDTPSPTQSSCSGSLPSRTDSSSVQKSSKGKNAHHKNPYKEPIIDVNEYPIDPNNVVASIHRNLNLSKQIAMKDRVTYIESRDDYNSLEVERGRREADVDSRNVEEMTKDAEFVLEDDSDSDDSIWNDCVKATCTLGVDDIYDEDELLGLAFVRD